ncbi:MAG TPA: autotransporter domain-containing protein [Stellaceae bacterium]|nr:autotransporter domain-containing protein [Stellaceae bacterium]
MRARAAFWAVGMSLLAQAAVAQSIKHVVTFGDSGFDSGYYKLLPAPGGGMDYDMAWPAAVAAGAGAPTTNPGLMSPQVLAAYFGLTAFPANQPGGTDYATSGAKNVTMNDSHTGGFKAAIPTVTQIANFLAANHGAGNDTLFLIGSGGNDVAYALGQSGAGPYPADPNGYIVGAASDLAAAIAGLKNAGGRFFIVPDLPYSFPLNDPTTQQARLLYSQALWSDIAASGVNFIPADYNAVRLAIQANPLSFGFISISNAAGHTACTKPANIDSAWALLCSPNPGAPSQLVAPNADQVYLFADDQHLTTAGQKIIGDYFYSLVVAPSEISLLPENALEMRREAITGIQQQIAVSQANAGALGFNPWIVGDIARYGFTNSTGFPGDPSNAYSGSVGVDHHLGGGLLIGAALSIGSQSPDFTLGGGFTQRQIAGSVYAGFRTEPWWGDVIGTYGGLDYRIDRAVPIGITIQHNPGNTGGRDVSIAVEGGYDFTNGTLTHGPIVGLTAQHIDVDRFTETGSFTSLSFASQTRDSAIGALGYRASIDIGNLTPFAQLVWDHEFISTGNRTVTASLTTIVAPGFSMPAIDVGNNWGTGTVGVKWKLTPQLTALGSFTGEFGQSRVAAYGGLLGLNMSF